MFSLSSKSPANDNEAKLYIPTPNEIEENYKKITSSRATVESALEYALSNNSDIANQPLLQLGVLSSFAEEHNDLGVLISVSDMMLKEIMPNLTADDYISILSNEDYTNAFKFIIIDMYSYAATSDETRNTKNFSLVDEKLKDFILPNSELSIVALTSIQDMSIIDYEQLANLLEKGTLAEQRVSLKILSEVYPAAVPLSLDI